MFVLNVKNENGRQSLKRMKKRSQVKKMLIKVVGLQLFIMLFFFLLCCCVLVLFLFFIIIID